MIGKFLSQTLPHGQSLNPAALDGSQETACVAASQGGDTLAFNRLVLKWEKAIFNLALRMLHDPEEAAEAAQEVFLSAFTNIRRFPGTRSFRPGFIGLQSITALRGCGRSLRVFTCRSTAVGRRPLWQTAWLFRALMSRICWAREPAARSDRHAGAPGRAEGGG